MEPELIILLASIFGSGGIGGIIGNQRGTQKAVNGLGEDISDIKTDVKTIRDGMYGPGSLDQRVTFLEAQRSSEE